MVPDQLQMVLVVAESSGGLQMVSSGWLCLLSGGFGWFAILIATVIAYFLFPGIFFLKLFTRNSGQKYPQNFFCAFKF